MLSAHADERAWKLTEQEDPDFDRVVDIFIETYCRKQDKTFMPWTAMHELGLKRLSTNFDVDGQTVSKLVLTPLPSP